MRVTLLDPLFAPESIAVFGISGLPGGSVFKIIQNLLGMGYSGKIFPVVSDCPVVCGLPTFSKQEILPEGVHLAIMCIPLEKMIPVLQYCSDVNIKTVVSLALEETETRPDEFFHQQQVIDLAREKGITLLGPKTLGVLNTQKGVNASQVLDVDHAGNIAFFSQSGSIFQSVLDLARDEYLGFSKCISMGSKSLINECDILEYLGDDPATRVILGYIEGVTNGPGFLRSAQRVAKKKPVIMIRPGSTPAGTRAALFHTDTMLGFADAYKAALDQTGIIRVPDIPSFLALAQGFSTQPLPQGRGVGILTTSGSFGVMAADAANALQLDLPMVSPAGISRIREMLPGYASVYNPVDTGPQADGETYARIMQEMEDTHGLHALVIILASHQGLDLMEMARSVADVAARLTKPLFVCLPGGRSVEHVRYFLQEQGVPCYRSLERALYTVRAMHDFQEWQAKPYPVEVCYRRDYPKIKKNLEDARKSGVLELSGIEAQGVLMGYELPFWELKLARTAKSAAKMSRKMGFPVVLKLASPQRTSDLAARGVRVGVEENAEVYTAFWELTEGVRRVWPEIFISGCMVQKMAGPTSRAVSIRMVRDPQFGALISFALMEGYGEGQEDVAYRLAPLNLEDAHDIIREIPAFPLLQGGRGGSLVHLQALEDILLTMSQMAMDCPEIIEAELCPVFVDHYEAVVADARIVLAAWDATPPA